MIWEGINSAANPAMFPDQLTGPHALKTWQVKKAFSGGSTAGTGGTTTAADCTTGFIPTPGANLDTVAGVWTGYSSPYLWPAGNIQGQTAGTPKIWAQVASEGGSAYPTQSRVMFQGTASPGCSRFGQTEAFVPFQPNTNPDGTANPLAGKDDAILYGATIQDPGGLPLGTLEYLTLRSVLQRRRSAVHGDVTPDRAGVRRHRGRQRGTDCADRLDSGGREAGRPHRSRRLGRRRPSRSCRATSAVTNNYKISALYTGGATTGYTDNVVRIVPAVEGRFHRWGKYGRVRPVARDARAAGPPPRSAPPRCSRWASARRSPSRSTSTTGRPRHRAAP